MHFWQLFIEIFVLEKRASSVADVGNLIGNDEEEVGEAAAAVSPSSGPLPVDDLAFFYIFE